MLVTPPQRWVLTQEALQRLLERLDADPEKAAHAYEALRARLIDFFDWRGVARPEVATDETLDRVARRLEDGEEIVQIGAYVHGVSRLVLFEQLRLQLREQEALVERARGGEIAAAGEPSDERVECLVRCLGELPDSGRELIVGYYEGPGVSHLDGRKLLAERLGLTYTALKVRAHRLRLRLEACLRECLSAGRAV